MKPYQMTRFLLALVLAIFFGCASGQSGGSAVLDVASLLNGTWKADGSDLRLEISSTGSALTGGAYNLFAVATGQAGGRTVNERAVIFIEQESGGVEVSVVPRFDPTASQLSDVGEPSEAEIRAACTFRLTPTPAGYSGKTHAVATKAPGITWKPRAASASV